MANKKIYRWVSIRLFFATIIGLIIFYCVWRQKNADTVSKIAYNRASKEALDNNRNNSEWIEQVTTEKLQEKKVEIENQSKKEIIEAFNLSFGGAPRPDIHPNTGPPGFRSSSDPPIS
jgi:ABC-type bacteriocin/lantibiotic exporter with double-glycine peptidase domain